MMMPYSSHGSTNRDRNEHESDGLTAERNSSAASRMTLIDRYTARVASGSKITPIPAGRLQRGLGGQWDGVSMPQSVFRLCVLLRLPTPMAAHKVADGVIVLWSVFSGNIAVPTVRQNQKLSASNPVREQSALLNRGYGVLCAC
jgi:hypothetical protein